MEPARAERLVPFVARTIGSFFAINAPLVREMVRDIGRFCGDDGRFDIAEGFFWEVRLGELPPTLAALILCFESGFWSGRRFCPLADGPREGTTRRNAFPFFSFELFFLVATHAPQFTTTKPLSCARLPVAVLFPKLCYLLNSAKFD